MALPRSRLARCVTLCAYAACHSAYELIADLTLHEDGRNTPGYALFAFMSPGKYRMEGTIPGADSDGLGSGKRVVVLDATTLWFYVPEPNQYFSVPAGELTADAPGDDADMMPSSVDRFIMYVVGGSAAISYSARRRRRIQFRVYDHQAWPAAA